jgi:hypothetical protein
MLFELRLSELGNPDMESLTEVLRASLALHNLPFTVLLVIVVGYWLLVCVGFLDWNATDPGMEWNGHGDVSVEGGALQSVLRFIHAGEAPLMAILSVLALCAWAFSVLANHYLNPGGGLLMAGALLIPNLVISLVLTRVLTKPMRAVFKALNRDYDEAVPIVGQVCQVITGEVTSTFGQATLETRGAPLTLQVRVDEAERLQRGDRALIIGEDKEKQVFRVVRYQEPKLED